MPQLAGLFHQIPGFFRVVISLWKIRFSGMERVCWSNGMVIAQSAITTQNYFQHLLAINSQFEGKSDLFVVKRGHVDPHGDGVMERTGGPDARLMVYKDVATRAIALFKLGAPGAGWKDD